MYGSYLIATGFLNSLAIALFFIFTRSLRHLLRYIAVFEREAELPFSQETVVRPTREIFHMKRQEIRDRFCIQKLLTTIVVIIIMLFLFKYAIAIYRLIIDAHDHVTI